MADYSPCFIAFSNKETQSLLGISSFLCPFSGAFLGFVKLTKAE
jgi:hypothetical protein